MQKVQEIRFWNPSFPTLCYLEHVPKRRKKKGIKPPCETYYFWLKLVSLPKGLNQLFRDHPTLLWFSLTFRMCIYVLFASGKQLNVQVEQFRLNNCAIFTSRKRLFKNLLWNLFHIHLILLTLLLHQIASLYLPARQLPS